MHSDLLEEGPSPEVASLTPVWSLIEWKNLSWHLDIKQSDELYITEPIFVGLWHTSFIWFQEPPEAKKNHKALKQAWRFKLATVIQILKSSDMLRAKDLRHIRPQEADLHEGVASGKVTQTPGPCLSKCPSPWWADWRLAKYQHFLLLKPDLTVMLVVNF